MIKTFLLFLLALANVQVAFSAKDNQQHAKSAHQKYNQAGTSLAGRDIYQRQNRNVPDGQGSAGIWQIGDTIDFVKIITAGQAFTARGIEFNGAPALTTSRMMSPPWPSPRKISPRQANKTC